MSDLEKFLHAETRMPLLIKAGLAHAQFETIHPFLDGNGRIGRLLITFLLCERKALMKPFLYLSQYFKQHRQQYYEHLQSVRDSGAWEEWLLFFLSGIIEVSRQATDTALRILTLRENHRLMITEQLGRTAGNGHRVLDHLYHNPIVSVSDIRQLVDVSPPAANNLVSRLADIGVLQEYTGYTRNRRFIYREYIDLFHEECSLA